MRFASAKKKLEIAIAELNRGECENIELRRQIDQLRKERLILNNVFGQLERDISANKKKLERVKLSINECELGNEEAKQRASALNKVINREREKFCGRFREGGRRQESDCQRMTGEMTRQVAVQKEQEKMKSLESPRGGKTKRKAYMVADEEEAFSEQVMHKKILKLSFLNTIQRRHIRQHQKNIEVFEQAFSTIKSTTGISDIEEIVKIFIDLEQRNFSLLTYVNTLNREIEFFDIRNDELQKQLANFKAREARNTELKDGALRELTEQIRRMQAASDRDELAVVEAACALATCRPLIWSIVQFLEKEVPRVAKCEASPQEHEENLNCYLMYIENMLLQFRSCLAAQPKYNVPQPKPPRNRTHEVRPDILPPMPVHAEDLEEEDVDDQPWTRQELRAKAAANIQKRLRKRDVAHPKVAREHDDPRREGPGSTGSKEESHSKSPSISGKPDNEEEESERRGKARSGR